MMGYWITGMGWWMALAGILFVLFWGAVIWLVVWGITRVTGQRAGCASIESPLEIAKRRYARGDISREEFDQIRRDLTGRPPPG